MAAEIGEEIGPERDRSIAKGTFGSDEKGRLRLVRRIFLLAFAVFGWQMAFGFLIGAVAYVMGKARSCLRSTFPEDRRGSSSAVSKWSGTM